MLDIYKKIKQRRTELGMSQQELANKVGYTGKSMISKVERGEIDLSTTMIKKFASALSISPGELLDANIPEFDAESIEIIDMYSKLTPEQKKIVRDLLRTFRN